MDFSLLMKFFRIFPTLESLQHIKMPVEWFSWQISPRIHWITANSVLLRSHFQTHTWNTIECGPGLKFEASFEANQQQQTSPKVEHLKQFLASETRIICKHILSRIQHGRRVSCGIWLGDFWRFCAMARFLVYSFQNEILVIQNTLHNGTDQQHRDCPINPPLQDARKHRLDHETTVRKPNNNRNLLYGSPTKIVYVAHDVTLLVMQLFQILVRLTVHDNNRK